MINTIGLTFSIVNWMSLPLIMWYASIPWQAGTLDTVSYLLLCMLPLFFSKLAGIIFVDLTAYKNLMISKKQITNLIAEPEDPKSGKAFVPNSHQINFSDVAFSYVQGEPVLKNLSFTAEDQKLTAIAGDSGSGKSTILNLIAGYYEPERGEISIGGTPINGAETSEVLRQISMVDQDVFLFDDTVRNNIRYARPEATDAELKQAILSLLKQKKTVLMIAHTLSIIKNADRILVVSDGKIAEAGTHEELISQNGKYTAMWNAEKLLST